MWPDRRLLNLFKIEHPIVLAPMAGAMDVALAAAVAAGGGLGSLPAAMLNADALREQAGRYRAQTGKRPINVNFFCHTPPVPNNAREHAWRERLEPYYRELGIDPALPVPNTNLAPFDDAFCALVEDLRPEVVSFHFGLPETTLLERAKEAGALVIASATTVKESRWLEQRGVDAVIAQGIEGGGHRGMFFGGDIAGQVGCSRWSRKSPMP
jgi:nitronate monooxygenase